MSPRLEELIRLYGTLHESPADERDIHFNRLKEACELEAQQVRLTWRDVMGFVKQKYFEGLRSENKRQGRTAP